MTILTPTSGRFDLEAIIDMDRANKPAGFDRTCIELFSMYEDGSDAQALIRQQQRRLGAGHQDDPHPPQVSGLSNIIERLAARYDIPAVREIVDADGVAYDEDSPMVKRYHRILKPMSWHSCLAEMDRQSVLMGQSYGRIYSTGKKLSVRIVAPQHILRVPDEVDPSDPQMDQAFTIRLQGDRYEHHTFDKSSGIRRMWILDKDGIITDNSPYGIEGFLPYDDPVLPAFVLSNRHLGGRAWATPRVGRLASALIASVLHGEMQSLALSQIASWIVFQTRDPSRRPPEFVGTSGAVSIHTDDSLTTERPSPLIKEVLEIDAHLGRLALAADSIPPTERDGQFPTGAALDAAERPLNALRTQGLEQAAAAEDQAFQIIRMFANGDFEGAPIPPDAEIRVTFPPPREPEEPSAAVESEARKIAIGLSSRIDAIMTILRCSREEAKQHALRVDRDQKEFGRSLDGDLPSAQQADTPSAVDRMAQAVGEGSADSEVDLANGVSSGEARDSRR